MTNKPINPLAFVSVTGTPGTKGTFQNGMSLRDYFAGQALAGYFAYQHAGHRNSDDVEVADYFYRMADAMLKVREEK